MRFFLVLAFLLAFVGSCFAQFDMGRMISSPAMALQRADIRKELKLTKEQDKTISKIEKDLTESMKDQATMMEGPAKMDAASQQCLAILDDKQKARLTEIRIQMRGSAAILDDDVAKPLALTDEQLAKGKEMKTKFQTDILALARKPSNNAMKEMMKLREQEEKDLLTLLTEEQRTQFKTMQGKEFKNARPKGSIF